ncbi:hypothetical protein AZZ74_001113, partial [Klebsiella pneumoniae]
HRLTPRRPVQARRRATVSGPLPYFARLAKRAKTASKIASPCATCSAVMVHGGTT